MVIEVDVEAGDNAPYSLHRMFSVLSQPVRVRQVHMYGPGDQLRPYAVTGWSEDGPSPAYAVLVEDSGEGRALLIYGGSEGIRLRPAESSGPWSLNDADQTGEPCLLLDRTTKIATEDPAQ
ncbi:MAG: hypothetical protein HY684_03980 [Chloroflexi bacterium]|nr:hypothetical protein [Chloroflexota bacterium]